MFCLTLYRYPDKKIARFALLLVSTVQIASYNACRMVSLGLVYCAGGGAALAAVLCGDLVVLNIVRVLAGNFYFWSGLAPRWFTLIARLSDTVAMECAPLNMLRGPMQGMGGLMFQVTCLYVLLSNVILLPVSYHFIDAAANERHAAITQGEAWVFLLCMTALYLFSTASQFWLITPRFRRLWLTHRTPRSGFVHMWRTKSSMVVGAGSRGGLLYCVSS